jgi:hypothetical protein
MSSEENPELPRDLRDRLFPRALQRPEALRAFLRQAVPAYADRFDCDRLRPLDRETFTPNWFSREADLPLEVPFRGGGGEEALALVLLLIEHQTAADPLLPLRMLFYAVCYWMDQLRRWEGQKKKEGPFRLGPVLPLVLHTGARPWGTNRDLRGLYEGPAEFVPFVPEWQPLIWELSGQEAEALAGTGEGWLQLLAVMRAEDRPAEEFRPVFAQAMQQLAALSGRDLVYWQELLHMVWSYVTWRRPTAERPGLQAEVETAHPERREAVSAMSRTIAEEYIEEGRLEALRATLLRQARQRFGELPAEWVQRVNALTALDRLQEALDRILTAGQFEDLGV